MATLKSVSFQVDKEYPGTSVERLRNIQVGRRSCRSLNDFNGFSRIRW